MQKVDNRRSTLLPVFDPCYKPSDRRHRHRLPLIQQQQQQQQQSHHHHSLSQECVHDNELCQTADRVSHCAAKMSETVALRRQKTSSEKKLKRDKVVTWKSLSCDTEKRRSSNSETVTEGKSQFISTNAYTYLQRMSANDKTNAFTIINSRTAYSCPQKKNKTNLTLNTNSIKHYNINRLKIVPSCRLSVYLSVVYNACIVVKLTER